MKFIKKGFPFLAILLLVPWPVAYAHTYTDDMAGHDAVRIAVAEPSEAPSRSVFGRAIGGIATPVDLFYIDATENAADIPVTLYLTNTQELSRCYRYLILKVSVFVEGDAGEWKKVSRDNGEVISDTFITLHDAQVIFILPGYAKHKITIESGSFYCVTTSTDAGSPSPRFYLRTD